jgi:prepilin-type N-terminal cleavage/methylation domain-containing protein
MRNIGFTLIELLVVIGILAVVAVVSAPIASNWPRRAQINTVQAEIIQALRLARARARAGYHNSRQGVYFSASATTTNKFVFYQGDSYQTRQANQDQETSLPSNLYFNLSLSNNAREINFSFGLSRPSATGTIFLIDNITGQTRNIVVNSFGVVGGE